MKNAKTKLLSSPPTASMHRLSLKSVVLVFVGGSLMGFVPSLWTIVVGVSCWITALFWLCLDYRRRDDNDEYRPVENIMC